MQRIPAVTKIDITWATARWFLVWMLVLSVLAIPHGSSSWLVTSLEWGTATIWLMMAIMLYLRFAVSASVPRCTTCGIPETAQDGAFWMVLRIHGEAWSYCEVCAIRHGFDATTNRMANAALVDRRSRGER